MLNLSPPCSARPRRFAYASPSFTIQLNFVDLIVNFVDLIDRLDAVLPQTQCQRCGYLSCRLYAQALASEQANTNQCPPGGQEGANQLAAVLEQPSKDLELSRGKPGVNRVARIVEALCIGCTKCLRACPVDAIIGANKAMHTVIPELCTGCELCLPPCPTDCIVMEPRANQMSQQSLEWTMNDANRSRNLFVKRTLRLEQIAAASQAVIERPESSNTSAHAPAASELSDLASNSAGSMEKALEKALERARNRLASHAAARVPPHAMNSPDTPVPRSAS